MQSAGLRLLPGFLPAVGAEQILRDIPVQAGAAVPHHGQHSQELPVLQVNTLSNLSRYRQTVFMKLQYV